MLVLIGVATYQHLKKSVDWWSTLHRCIHNIDERFAIDPVLLYPLMFSIVAFIGLILRSYSFFMNEILKGKI